MIFLMQFNLLLMYLGLSVIDCKYNIYHVEKDSLMQIN